MANMANVIGYTERFERILVNKYEAEMKSYDLTQSNPGVTFLNAQTIKLPRLTVSGYKDHNRNSINFNTGVVSNDWEPKKLQHDRDIEFPIDPMDVDESNLVASIANTFLLSALPSRLGVENELIRTMSRLRVFEHHSVHIISL